MKNIKIRKNLSLERLHQAESTILRTQDRVKDMRYNLENVAGAHTLQSELRESERIFEEVNTHLNRLARLKRKCVEEFYQLDRNIARDQESELRQRQENLKLDKYRSNSNLSRLDWILNTKGEWLKGISTILGVQRGKALFDVYTGRFMPKTKNDLEYFGQRIDYQLSNEFDGEVETLNVPMSVGPVALVFQFVNNVLDKIPKCYDPSRLVTDYPELIFYISEKAVHGMQPDIQLAVKRFKSAWYDYVGTGTGAVELGIVGGIGIITKHRLNHLTGLTANDWMSHEKNLNKTKKKKIPFKLSWDDKTESVGGEENHIFEAFTGIWNIIIDPIDTLKRVGHAVLHPVQTGKEINVDEKANGATKVDVEGMDMREWIPEVMKLDGTSEAEQYLAAKINNLNNRIGKQELKWNQEKINQLWDASQLIYEEYGIQVDPRLLLSIIFQEGTGSFNTSAANLAADGQHGVETDFAKDLMKANNLIFGKILGYIYYGKDFNHAVENNNEKAGIDGKGDFFQYANWNTPIVDLNRGCVRRGVYASHGAWHEGVQSMYEKLSYAGASLDYSSYLSELEKSTVINITDDMKLPDTVFQSDQSSQNHLGQENGEYIIHAK